MKKSLAFLGGFPCCSQEPREGVLRRRFLQNLRLSWLWRFECQMYCWGQYPWLFFVSLPVALGFTETPFAKTPFSWLLWKKSENCSRTSRPWGSKKSKQRQLSATGDSQRDSRESIRANRFAPDTPIFIARQAIRTNHATKSEKKSPKLTIFRLLDPFFDFFDPRGREAPKIHFRTVLWLWARRAQMSP